MKKNSGTVGTIVGIILSVIIACATILLIALKFENLKIYDWLLVAFFAVIGLIDGYLCHNLLHETGHLIFAKLKGAKIFEVAFCGFVFTSGKKPKINLKSGVGGWTSFVPSKPSQSEKVLNASLYGGLTGSFLSLLISYALFQVGRLILSPSLIVAFGFYNAVNFYLIVLNFFSLKSGTDGLLMINKNGKTNDYFLYKVAELEYQSHMLNGKAAEEIEKLTATNYDSPTIFDVEKSLQEGKFVAAKDYIEKIISDGKIDDNGLIDLLLEDLFIASVHETIDVIEKKAEKVYSYILEPDSLLSYRAAIFYRRCTGETAWADGLEKTYFKLIESCPLEGLKKQEKRIYDLYTAF